MNSVVLIFSLPMATSTSSEEAQSYTSRATMSLEIKAEASETNEQDSVAISSVMPRHDLAVRVFVCVRTHERSANARLHAMDQRTSNEGKRACRKERVG